MTTRRNLPSPIPGDIASALEELGIRYVVRDTEAHALCPNPEHHDRKMGNWSCNLVTGMSNCFSCGFGGPFVRLVAVVRGTSRSDATRWVRKRGGVERGRSMVSGRGRESRPVRQFTEADLALFDWPPTEAMEVRGFGQAAAQTYGVLWDTVRGMWIIPVRDPHTFRLRGWQEKEARCFRNVPYGLQKADCVFGLDKVRKGKPVILLESPLDCLRLWHAGIPGAVASYGAEVSMQQLDVLREVADRLICALDDDNAGWKRAAWIKEHWRKPIRYFDYDAAWAGQKRGRKDPGEMTNEEIRRGVGNAYSSLIARF